MRKIIYTTNSIESLNYQLRKIIKNRGHFPNDDAVIKLLWLAIRDIEDKRARERAKEAGRSKNERTAPPSWSRAAPCRAGTPPTARSALPSPAGSSRSCDQPDRGQARMAGFLHDQPTLAGAQPRSTRRPGRNTPTSLTAASTGTPSKAEEPRP